MTTLPTPGTTAYDRISKWRVAAIVEGHVIARRHRGSLVIMTAAEWAQLLPYEWTEADRIADDGKQLLRQLRFPADCAATVERTPTGWIVRYYRPKQWHGLNTWSAVPVEFVVLKRPARVPLLDVTDVGHNLAALP